MIFSLKKGENRKTNINASYLFFSHWDQLKKKFKLIFKNKETKIVAVYVEIIKSYVRKYYQTTTNQIVLLATMLLPKILNQDVILSIHAIEIYIANKHS